MCLNFGDVAIASSRVTKIKESLITASTTIEEKDERVPGDSADHSRASQRHTLWMTVTHGPWTRDGVKVFVRICVSSVRGPSSCPGPRGTHFSSSVHETHRRWGQEREPTLREKRGNRKLRCGHEIRGPRAGSCLIPPKTHNFSRSNFALLGFMLPLHWATETACFEPSQINCMARPHAMPSYARISVTG